MAPISCIITSFNNKQTLSQAVISVLKQSLPVKEIVIADDCSTDGSQVLITEIAEKYSCVTPILRKENIGVAANRDLAIRSASAPFVTHLDGDDLFSSRKIQSEWNVINGKEDVVAYSNIARIVPNKFLASRVLNPSSTLQGDVNSALQRLLGRTSAIPRDMLLSKSLYEKAGGFTHGVPLYEDWQFKLRLAMTGSIWLHSSALGTLYFHRQGSLSKAHLSRHQEWMNKIIIDILPQLSNFLTNQQLSDALSFSIGEEDAFKLTGKQVSHNLRRTRLKQRFYSHVRAVRYLPQLVLSLKEYDI